MHRKLILTSSSQKSLNVYIKYLKLTFKIWNIQPSIFYLPTNIKRICLLKSPHVNKKAKEHFEIRNYRRIISFESTSEFESLTYLIANKPKTIDLKMIF
jgi:ribosomal protein S10